MLLEECKHIDVIITTALIPGRKAPVLIKKHHVEAMPSGGVTIDLAAASGGNVETTVAGERATNRAFLRSLRGMGIFIEVLSLFACVFPATEVKVMVAEASSVVALTPDGRGKGQT